MNEHTGYTATPTMQFKWFPKPPDIFDILSHGDKPMELRQAFSCSDGKTRWKAVEVATDAEQQEEAI